MFSRFEIPTPFQVGPVNAYLAGRTIVDPGPDSEAAWDALCVALEERELAPSDVSRVLITHPHPDHFGVARRLADAGAEVLASPEAATIVGDFAGRLAYEQSFFVDFFERCGMGRDDAESVTRLPEAFLPYVEDVAVDRELDPGDDLVVDDVPVAVDALAGHAVGERRFTVDEPADGGDITRRVSVVGDAVLPSVTPTPFLQPPPADGADRPRVLPAYNDCLAALREAPIDRFLPGHGDPIDAPGDRIDALLDAHETRTERVRGLIDGPTTPHAVVTDLFPDLPATEQFGGMSEAVGHLDVLEARGDVTRREDGGLLVYERSDGE